MDEESQTEKTDEPIHQTEKIVRPSHQIEHDDKAIEEGSEENWAQERPPNNNSVSQKRNWELWIGVANLILWLTSGVFIVLYVAKQDRELQRELIGLQAEIERQTSLAHLQIERTCNWFKCLGGIRIENTGPAFANDVSLVFAITEIEDSWKTSFYDIQQLQFETEPFGVIYTVEPIQVTGRGTVQDMDHNVYQLRISSLVLDESVYIWLRPHSSLRTEQVTIHRDVTIYSNAPLQFASGWINPDLAMEEYLGELNAIARVSVQATCNNCDGSPVGVSSYVTSLDAWGIESVSMQEVGGGYESFHILELRLQVPQDEQFDLDTSHIILEADIHDEDKSMTLRESR